jgi:hypothetical protein
LIDGRRLRLFAYLSLLTCTSLLQRLSVSLKAPNL